MICDYFFFSIDYTANLFINLLYLEGDLGLVFFEKHKNSPEFLKKYDTYVI